MNFMVMNEIRKTGRSMKLGVLLTDLNLDLPADSLEIEISGITDDSRGVNRGDLFVAVPGYITDGRKYIAEAASLGAVAVLTSPGKDIILDIPVIFSGNLRSTLAAVADRFFGHPSTKLKVAGITGTNGKTTTAFLLSSIFESTGQKWGKIGTIGYDIGGPLLPGRNTTPGAIEIHKYLAHMVDNGLSGCSIEVSSHALDQGRCENIKFDSATFTNLTQDHLDYHHDMESYFTAKARLFENAPISIVNIDDEYGRRLIDRISGNVVTFASEREADLNYRYIDVDIHGSSLEFVYDGKAVALDLPLPGLFNHQNAAAAAATAIGLGLSLEEAVGGLSGASAVPGRLEPLDMGQPFGIYIDYAHTPNALDRLLRSLRMFNPANLRLVFGCGGDRDKKKRPIMGEIASKLSDIVYLTSDNPRTEDPTAIIEDTLKGICDRRKCNIIEDRGQAIASAISSATKGDIVAIAGKGHEDYQVIGSVKKYFSDMEIAKSVLRKLGYENDGG